MFRHEYTKLTTAQIDELLNAAPTCPVSASSFSDRLAGSFVKIATDDGPVLEYSFGKDGWFTLSEDGKPVAAAVCSVLELGELQLVAHRIPGTKRCYLIAADMNTRLVTVLEAWFGGAPDPRELQRVIYHGYMVSEDSPAPEARHASTGRLEGKAILWKDDMGVSIQTMYSSILYSSFVEISHPRGGLTICAPSDFVKIDDRHFIYSRVEAEFSGTLVFDVMDLFTLRQIGVRIGLDEEDEFDFRMYRAKGKMLGQFATFESFLPNNAPAMSPPPGTPQMPEKGARFAYRPYKLTHPMTREEVNAKVAATPEMFVGDMQGNKEKMLPFSDILSGLEFTLKFDDGPVWCYIVKDKHNLLYRSESETVWHDEHYEAFEPGNELALLAHVHTGSCPHESVTMALDLKKRLVTCVFAKMGNQYADREVDQTILFGVIELGGIKPPKHRRHCYTTEMVGRSYTWSYNDKTTSQHIYSSPYSYSWTIMLANGAGGLMWSSPCKYVKVRDGVYLMTWVEEHSSGQQGVLLFNTATMHDCGAFYGINHDQIFEYYTFGAESRYAGQYDLTGIYGL